MKALVYTGVETLTYQDRPMPDRQNDEVLVRVHASGICGSDMHAYLGHDARRPSPLTLGHEAAGVISGGAEDGRRVTINPLLACQRCEYCRARRENLCPNRQIISMQPREGAFADYVTMPLRNLVTVPDHVPLAHAALAEPIACGWHAVRLGKSVLGGDMSQMRCAVIGGGAIGVGAALSLAAQGARDITVVEPNEVRRSRLADVAGFEVCAPNEDAMPGSGSVDFVIDAVGYAATRETCSALARAGGVIAHIGLGEATGGLDVRRMTLQEITFIGTYTYTAADFVATAEAIFDGSLGDLDWIEERPLSEGHAAFKDIRAGAVAAPKIILNPDHSSLAE